VAVQVHKSNEGRFVEFNSLLSGDFLQRVVYVRQMIRGDIAHEGAGDFVVAHAAMQPAEEQDKLHAGGNDGCQYAIPVKEAWNSFGVRRLAAAFPAIVVNGCE